jgi:hypothetical protein
MKKTPANLPELAQRAADDNSYRDQLFWTMVTLHPNAFLKLVNGEPMSDHDRLPLEKASLAEPTYLMTDFTGHTLAVDADLFCKVRNFSLDSKWVEAIMALRAGANLCIKEAQSFVEGTFPRIVGQY